jgi:hypothetical protein
MVFRSFAAFLLQQQAVLLFRNPHHIDADPEPTFNFDPDPDPACHFDANLDPSFQLKSQDLEKMLKQDHIPYILAGQSANFMWIQLITLMRIRIHNTESEVLALYKFIRYTTFEKFCKLLGHMLPVRYRTSNDIILLLYAVFRIRGILVRIRFLVFRQ